MKIFINITSFLLTLNLFGQQLTQNEFDIILNDVKKKISFVSTNKDYNQFLKKFNVSENHIDKLPKEDIIINFNQGLYLENGNYITPFFQESNLENVLICTIYSVSIIPNDKKDLSELDKGKYHFILKLKISINEEGSVSYKYLNLLSEKVEIENWWKEINQTYLNLTEPIYDKFGFTPPPPPEIPSSIEYSGYHLAKMSNKYLNEKDFNSAKFYVDKLIEMYPENPEGYLKRGFIKLVMSNGTEGCGDIKKASILNKENREKGIEGQLAFLKKKCNIDN